MKDTFKVLSGSAHTTLTNAICENLGIPPCSVTLDTFPDGETFVQINENIRGRDVFIVQPTCPPTNQNIMELLIMVDAVRRASANRITAVLPFFGYARQDRKDRPRVPITAKLVANLMVAAGVNRVLTMDLHAGQIQGFFDIPVDHLYAAPVLVKAIKERIGEDLVVVSPDVGGIKMTHAFAKAFNAEGMTGLKDPGVSASTWDIYKRVLGDGGLTVRVFALWQGGRSIEGAKRLIAERAAMIDDVGLF